MTDRPKFTKCDAIEDDLPRLSLGDIVQIGDERFKIACSDCANKSDPSYYFFRAVKNTDAGRLTDSPAVILGDIVQIEDERFRIACIGCADKSDPLYYFFRAVKNADAGRLTGSPDGIKRIKAEV